MTSNIKLDYDPLPYTYVSGELTWHVDVEQQPQTLILENQSCLVGTRVQKY